MPVYDYECVKCARKFEARKSFSEGARAECPLCNSVAQRVFTPVPIVFKGSGFYVTDYRKEKPPAEEAPACASDCKTACSSAANCASSGAACPSSQ